MLNLLIQILHTHKPDDHITSLDSLMASPYHHKDKGIELYQRSEVHTQLALLSMLTVCLCCTLAKIHVQVNCG